MKFRKRYLLLAIMVTTVLIRGVVFRQFVVYQVSENRRQYQLTDPKLINTCNAFLNQHPGASFDDLAAESERLTKNTLTFTFGQALNDPNQTCQTGQANCIGYAAMYDAILDYMLSKSNIKDQYTTRCVTGHQYLFGFNLNTLIDHPFFADHDFNLIENRSNGAQFGKDVSVGDFFMMESAIQLTTSNPAL